MRNNLSNRREMTLDDIRAKAPSVFATQPVEGVSDRYQFIETSSIVENMMKEGFIPVMAAECKVRNLSKVGFAKHILRFRHESFKNLVNNSEVPEIVLVNSHDRSSAYTLTAGIFRLVCANGLIVASETFEKLSIKHMGNQIDKVIEGSYRIIEELPQVMGQIDKWKQTKLELPQQLDFATKAMIISGSTLELEARQLISARRFADYVDQNTKQRDLYTTMNVVQENLIRGGVIGMSSNGKYRRTKAITGINADTKLNKDLWKLTEDTAQLLQIAA